MGRQIGSAALVADGLHARTDGFTSLAVLFGAAGVALGWRLADPIVGLLITLAILGVLRSAVRQVGARLMDAVEPELVDQAVEAVLSVPGIGDVRDLRIRWIGHTLRAEVDATVSPEVSLADAHELPITPSVTSCAGSGDCQPPSRHQSSRDSCDRGA